MDGQTPVVFIVRLGTEDVEHLGDHHRRDEVKGVLRIRCDDEQSGLPVAQGIKFQLIVGCQVT